MVAILVAALDTQNMEILLASGISRKNNDSSSRTILAYQFLLVMIKQLLGNILGVHIRSDILTTHLFYSQEAISAISLQLL